MNENLLISYLGENKPNLISEITSFLTEKGGEFSGVTFATLGRVCELTMVYKTKDKTNLDDLIAKFLIFHHLKMAKFKLNHSQQILIQDLHLKLLTELYCLVMTKKVYLIELLKHLMTIMLLLSG